jgi:hypothetical protein
MTLQSVLGFLKLLAALGNTAFVDVITELCVLSGVSYVDSFRELVLTMARPKTSKSVLDPSLLKVQSSLKTFVVCTLVPRLHTSSASNF